MISLGLPLKTVSEVLQALEGAVVGRGVMSEWTLEGWSWSPDSKLSSSWVWACSPVIPALREVEVRGSGVQAQPGTHSESLFKRTKD